MLRLVRLLGAPHACTNFERTTAELLKEFGFVTSQSAGDFVIVLGGDPDRAAKATEAMPGSVVVWVPLTTSANEALNVIQRGPIGPAATLAIGEAGMKNALLHFAAVRAARGEEKMVEQLREFRRRQTEAVLAMELPE
ncbi:MAG: hypothetical protein JSR82_14375 [Verrucomicrobia bacterium]|nr:hypothetical protein [Verrucomicrobiota bacterium]